MEEKKYMYAVAIGQPGGTLNILKVYDLEETAILYSRNLKKNMSTHPKILILKVDYDGNIIEKNEVEGI